MKAHARTISIVIIFCIAMASLESAVVVYLRALYYPEGFTVALKMVDKRILQIEIFREVATLIMLWAISYLAGRNFKEKIACFLLSFAVWDIFYYIWLKIFIHWPLSLFDWDILFLIPIAWLGPVAAPILCSVNMIVLAFILLCSTSTHRLSITAWSLLAGGTLVILFTFLKDYAGILINNGFLSDYVHIMDNEAFLAIASTFVPKSYSWDFFWIGEITIVVGIVKVYLELSKERLDCSVPSR